MMLQLNIDQTEFIVHTDSEYNSYVHPRLWSVAHSCVTLWFIVYTLHLNCDYWSRGGQTQLTFAANFNQFTFWSLPYLPLLLLLCCVCVSLCVCVCASMCNFVHVASVYGKCVLGG